MWQHPFEDQDAGRFKEHIPELKSTSVGKTLDKRRSTYLVACGDPVVLIRCHVELFEDVRGLSDLEDFHRTGVLRIELQNCISKVSRSWKV